MLSSAKYLQNTQDTAIETGGFTITMDSRERKSICIIVLQQDNLGFTEPCYS